MSEVGRFGVFLPSYVWEGDGPVRARGIKRQSDLINRLLEEEEERLESSSVLRATAASVRRSVFDDRLL